MHSKMHGSLRGARTEDEENGESCTRFRSPMKSGFGCSSRGLRCRELCKSFHCYVSRASLFTCEFPAQKLTLEDVSICNICTGHKEFFRGFLGCHLLCLVERHRSSDVILPVRFTQISKPSRSVMSRTCMLPRLRKSICSVSKFSN